MKKEKFILKIFNLLANEQEIYVNNFINEETVFSLLKERLNELKTVTDVIEVMDLKLYNGKIVQHDTWLKFVHPGMYKELLERRKLEAAQRKEYGIED